MGTVIIIYAVSGILYTIACCMDGPDLKPRWKKALGKKLEKVSNYFYPIEYFTKTEYLPGKPAYIEETTFDVVRVESQVMIGEGELYLARMQEERACQQGRQHLIPRWGTVSYIVEEAKRRCGQELLEQAKQAVTIKVDEESLWPGIIINGYMYIGMQR